jgi:hypothetical protein
MNCQDILVNRKLEFTEISAVFSQIYSLSDSEILVLDEIPFEAISSSVRLLCQVQDIAGNFTQLISIYIKDTALEKISIKEVVGQICDICGCVCLISDDSNNPYSMILVKTKGNYQKVYLSAELLEEEKYVLIDDER